jgi:predicted MFS family arabinose efflux permease
MSSSPTPEIVREPTRMSRTIVLLMALATGLAVASNYYAQPLLHTIGKEFALSNAAAGAIVTVAQLSYATGLMFLVPLGDFFERRSLIVILTALSSVGLLITASSSTMTDIFIGTAVTGILSVVAQLLVPFAATLASNDERGRVLGTVMSGLLMGILLARTVSGALADLGGWRTVYWVAAILLMGLSALLWRFLPRYRVATTLSYPMLLRSVLLLFVEEPLFRARALLGGLAFAAFSVFWTSLTFLLSAPPFSFPNTTIGLFGLAGAAGAVAASRFGRLADRGLGNRSTLIGLTILTLSWIAIGYGSKSIPSLIVGIIGMDLAVQGVHVTNQSAIYRLRPESRSRLASGYMTSYFAGGAFGSLSSAAVYSYAGWLGVCLLGGALSALALVYSALAPNAKIPEIRHALR